MMSKADPYAYLAGLNIDSMRFGLEAITELLKLLGNPQNSYKAILIAGTNGKGSTAAMAASILHSAGYKVGLYTSPHLIDVRERIVVNGKKITKSFSLDEEISLHFTLKNDDEKTPINIGFQIFTADGTYVFGTNSNISKVDPFESGVHDVEVIFKQSLLPGTYHITLAIMSANDTQVLRYIPKITTFNIKQQTDVQGITMLDNRWIIK